MPSCVARVLDAAEEQRVVAAPVRALDAGDEVGQRAVDERRVARRRRSAARARPRRAGPRSDPTARSGSRTARSRRSGCPRGAGRTSSCAGRPRSSTSGGSSETDMNALAVMPWTCVALERRDDRDAGGEHAERLAQRDRGSSPLSTSGARRSATSSKGLAPIPSGPAQLRGKSNSAGGRALRSAGASSPGRRTGTRTTVAGIRFWCPSSLPTSTSVPSSAYWTAIRHSAMFLRSVGLRVPLVITPTRLAADVDAVAVAGRLVALELEPDEPALRVRLALDQRLLADEVVLGVELDREADARPRTGRPGRRTRSRRRSGRTRCAACRARRGPSGVRPCGAPASQIASHTAGAVVGVAEDLVAELAACSRCARRRSGCRRSRRSARRGSGTTSAPRARGWVGGAQTSSLQDLAARAGPGRRGCAAGRSTA